MCWAWAKKSTNMEQKSTMLGSKTNKLGAKILQNRSKEASWEALGAILAPGGPQEPKSSQKHGSRAHPGPPKMRPCWRVLGSCWGYVGRCWWQVDGQQALLPNMKQQMAKDSPRWTNIALKNTQFLEDFGGQVGIKKL